MNATVALGKGTLVLNETPKAGMFTQVRFVIQNKKGVPLSYATLEGKHYLVVPMIMLTEGVHVGSAGPLYYPNEELGKTPVVWNHKPVVVYHPQINGVGVSACDPVILEGRKIGLIMNAEYKEPSAVEVKNAASAKQPAPVGKLHAEAWIDVEKTKKVDDRIMPAIENGETMELSTGLFTDNEMVENGVWRGEKYGVVARNYRPDHLAVLPDQKGACSIADGAGFLRLNAVSFGATRDLISYALRELLGVDNYAYVEDVFPGFFVYCQRGVLNQHKYTATETAATIVGTPTEVVRVVQYRTSDGAVVGNVEIDPNINLHFYKEIVMLRTAIITAMIANGHWGEADRDWLTKLEEPRFLKIKENADAIDKLKAAPANNIQQAAQTGAGQLVGNTTTPAPRQMTLKELIDAADPATRGMLANGLRAFEAQKTSLVAAILANKACPWKKEQLDAMDVDMLQNLATMAGVTATPVNVGTYAGLADAFAPRGQVQNFNPQAVPADVTPMELPTMNFGPVAKS